MIPVRLKLNNFLPYRGEIPALNFDGIHLACISGDNGAGKTSIIDAITWTLWGKSRLRSKSTSDDDLISQGESETSVTFDFRTSDGQLYRVNRRRTKPKRAGGAGQSTLNLFIASCEGFKTFSGNNISETEQKITSILHLDYETFINSAYLKQGEADNFTNLRPGDRKEILGKILGLDAYDSLAEMAKSKAVEASASGKMLTDSIELERLQLERKPELEAALMTARRELNEAEKAMGQKRKLLENLRQTFHLIQARDEALCRAELAAKELETDLQAQKNEKIETLKSLEIHQKIIANREEVERGYSRYQAVRELADRFNSKLGTLHRLEKAREQLERIIAEERHKLIRTRDSWQKIFDDLSEKAAAKENLKILLNDLKIEGDILTERENQIDAEKLTLQKLRVDLAAIEAELQEQKRRLAETTDRVGMLSSAGEATCPVCEAELKEDRLKIVQSRYSVTISEIQNRIDELAIEKNDKLLEISALERHLALASPIKSERSNLISREARLLQELEDAEKASKRLPEGQKQLDAKTREIESAEFASAEQKQLASLKAEIETLGYDAASHEATASELKHLEVFDRRYRELMEASNFSRLEAISLGKIENSIKIIEERLSSRLKEIDEAKEALSNHPRVDPAQILSVETKVKELKDAVSGVSERVGSIKQELAHLEELTLKIADKSSKVQSLASDESIYKDLQKAFGKNGIQALLIENAIPEMEDEANRLLNRMTDNRMSLKIEPVRLTKKGDTIETFDIKIADELGTRDYDLFSGGEAFRINFALRLALSWLLTRRAGAPLRTLIIDEGFGTQDAAGIEKLKEAICSIQDQFDCILVITHIEEFKDAFPTRIEVFKTPEGSNIRVTRA